MPKKPARRSAKRSAGQPAARPPESPLEDLPAAPLSREDEANTRGGNAGTYTVEAEKNLGIVFGAAKQTDAILFFDESDTLFK
jgi:hypothetical protein